jgi:penicillin-binding protein 1A
MAQALPPRVDCCMASAGNRGGGGDGLEEEDDIIGIDMEDEDPRPGRGRRGNRRRVPVGNRRQRLLRGLKLGGIGVLVGGAACLLLMSGLFLYYGSDPKLPNLKKLSDYKPPQMTRVLDRNGALIGSLGSPERRRVVPLSLIPKHFLNAVIAAEDPSFYKHEGIDYWAVVRSQVTNLLGGRIGPGRWGQGGSTITQQVVKLLLLSPEKTARRKIQEIILARRLSRQLSKDEILSIYVNQVNYGGGHYGCEEAAQHYFGKSIKDVTLAEAAFLAGVPQRPESHSPYKNPESAMGRRLYVLRQMVQHGYIDEPTANTVAKQPLQVLPQSKTETGFAPEAVGAVQRLLAEKYSLEVLPTLGTTVKTTVDLPLQKLARESLERGLEGVDQRQGYRGPSGHLDGQKLEQYRYELRLARELGKGGAAAKAAADEAARTKRPQRYGLRPIGEYDIFQGVVDRVERDDAPAPGTKPAHPPGQSGRLVVDMGGRQGVVDLSAETRYTRGPKPWLVDRFRAGDLVRVRIAGERRRHTDPPDAPPPLALELGPQAAMVVLDPHSHEVLALVGGYNYRAGGFDRSQRASRQPGSAFKPFVYAAALMNGKTPASMVNDAPEVYDLWKPQNYEKEQFRGPISVRTAMANSINTVAIRLLNEVGVPKVVELATRSGITTPLPPDVGLSLALGSNSVNPLELANAFATFADGGTFRKVRLVTGIEGEELPNADEPVPAIRPEIAYLVVSLMRSVVEEGTARAAGARIHRPLAGKTGTSSDKRDAWFVGFSPDLLAAVWLGYDDGKPLGEGEAGGRTAVPIWTEFMAKALADRPVKDFAAPPGIEVARIDPATGLLPPPGVEGIEEVFLAGTAPRETTVTPEESSKADQLLFGSTPSAPAPAPAPTP